MNVKNLFLLNTVLALLFGLAFVLVPGPLTELYDVDLSEGGRLIGQLFGASLLGFSIISWLVKDAGPSEERQAIMLAFFIGNAIGFVASLLAQLGEVANALGWSTVVLYLILAVGFGYFRFVATEEAALA